MKIKITKQSIQFLTSSIPYFQYLNRKFFCNSFALTNWKQKFRFEFQTIFLFFFFSLQQESNLLTKSIARMVSKSSLAICCRANCEWLSTRNVHVKWNMSHGFSKEKARVNCFSSVIHRINYLLSLWQTERKTLLYLLSNYRDWLASISKSPC